MFSFQREFLMRLKIGVRAGSEKGTCFVLMKRALPLHNGHNGLKRAHAKDALISCRRARSSINQCGQKAAHQSMKQELDPV